MKTGDRIRIQHYIMGYPGHLTDHTVEEFRHCLGVFISAEAREAGHFTPLCELYELGPESETKYISNYGVYYTNMVQSWMDIP